MGDRSALHPSPLSHRLVPLLTHGIRIALLARIQVFGRENIPSCGPYIVLTNHINILDIAAILMAFPLVDWRYFTGDKWRRHPIFGPFMTLMGAVYIRKGRANLHPFRTALEALQNDGIFGIAPEGGRSPEKALLKGKSGAAYLALRSGVPIVPVGIVNTDRIYGNWKRLRVTRVEVRVGKPFMLPKMDGPLRMSELSSYTHYMMIHIAALLPPRYRGYYRESPALSALLKGDDPWELCREADLPLHSTTD